MSTEENMIESALNNLQNKHTPPEKIDRSEETLKKLDINQLEKERDIIISKIGEVVEVLKASKDENSENLHKVIEELVPLQEKQIRIDEQIRKRHTIEGKDHKTTSKKPVVLDETDPVKVLTKQRQALKNILEKSRRPERQMELKRLIEETSDQIEKVNQKPSEETGPIAIAS